MKKSILLILMGLVSIGSYSQINSGNPTVPFGSKTSYNYGIMPSNLPSGGTYGASKDAASAYDAWKSGLVVTCSDGSMRVLYDDNSSTVSEGIGYGMLLSAYAGDKSTFDALWKYYKGHSNGNGLMNWKYSDCNSSSGQNGATDADEDAAMALIIAEEQWPTASSPYDYKSEASFLISKIRQYEIDQSTYQTINGDAWGFNPTCRNPSYFAPSYYREFAKIETSNASFWNSAVSTSQSYLLTNRNNSTGLVSNWSDPNGSPNTCNGPQDFGWDAIRNPWRMTTDVLWYGTTTATTASDICNKISAWAKSYADNLKGPVALSASNPSSGQYKCGTFAMLGLPFMAAGSSYQTALNTAYTTTVNLGNTEVYFSRTLRCITLFMMTGNFWKPGSSSPIPPTATITAASATTFCNGGSVVLNASTGTGYSYQWKKDNNNINGATTASYTATTSGSYTVVVTANSLSTTSTATVVTVNASPTANAGTDIALCQGKSTTLIATGGGSYLWSNNSTSASITVSPTATTSYTITVTGSNTCKSADTVVVTVNALPNANAGADVSICYGKSATLTASGGTSYIWNNSITNASNTVSPTSTTTYRVTVTNSNNCTAADSVVVTVNQTPSTPSVTSTVTYTVGATATKLTANGTNLIWYNVATGGTALSGAPTPSTGSSGTTSYYVTQTVNSCESDRAKIDVIVNPVVVEKIKLIAGWNIIGCPITGSTDLSKALSSIWSYVETVKNLDSFYNKTQNAAFNSLLKLNWGEGYLIKVTSACELDWTIQ